MSLVSQESRFQGSALHVSGPAGTHYLSLKCGLHLGALASEPGCSRDQGRCLGEAVVCASGRCSPAEGDRVATQHQGQDMGLSEDFTRWLVLGAGPPALERQGQWACPAPAWRDPMSLAFSVRTCRGEKTRLSHWSDPQRGWWDLVSPPRGHA